MTKEEMRSRRYRILRTVSYTSGTAKKGIERVVVARRVGTLVLQAEGWHETQFNRTGMQAPGLRQVLQRRR